MVGVYLQTCYAKSKSINFNYYNTMQKCSQYVESDSDFNPDWYPWVILGFGGGVGQCDKALSW